MRVMLLLWNVNNVLQRTICPAEVLRAGRAESRADFLDSGDPLYVAALLHNAWQLQPVAEHLPKHYNQWDGEV